MGKREIIDIAIAESIACALAFSLYSASLSTALVVTAIGWIMMRIGCRTRKNKEL